MDYGATYWRMIDPTVLDLTMKPKPHRPELNCSVKWQDIVQRHHSLLYLPVHVHSYDWEVWRPTPFNALVAPMSGAQHVLG